MTDQDGDSESTPSDSSGEDRAPIPPETEHAKGNGLFAVAFVVGFLALCIFLSLPAINGGPASKRTGCLNNLRNISIALHLYHEAYGAYPPAYIADDNGTPMHSWRVLLIGLLDRPDIARAYRFDEPWNSPHNLKLADTVRVFNCPSQSDKPSLETNYLAVIGEHTFWPGARPRLKEEVTDGPENTILLVEVADSGILWTEPRDLHFSQMNPKIGASDGKGLSSHHEGVMVSFASTHTRILPEDTAPEVLKALLTVDGGEPVIPNGRVGFRLKK